MKTALIDRGAIYGMIDRTDKYHAAAQAFGTRWLTEANQFVLLDWVFIEAMTLLKRHLGAALAVQTGQLLRRSPLYRWVTVAPDDEREVWATFQKYTDKGWSYIDCGLLVMSQRLKVAQVFTFDAHFDQMPSVKRVGG
jgi:predicted nucleic acid-binding protein